MENNRQDEICQKIFVYLATNNRPFRFNELHKELNKKTLGFKISKCDNIGISKPTLLNHLKHLENSELINRKQLHSQCVIYETSPKIESELKKRSDYIQFADNWTKSEQRFNRASIDDRVIYTSEILHLQEIIRLKFAILTHLEPNERFANQLAYNSIKQILDIPTEFLLRNCLNSKEAIHETLKALEKEEDELSKELFAIPDQKYSQNSAASCGV